MESSLLDIGTNDGVAQGIFYMVLCFTKGTLHKVKTNIPKPYPNLRPNTQHNQSLILPKHSQFNYNFRYMETGCYKGFFHHLCLPNLLKYFKLRDSNIIPWKVYTGKDFQLHKSSKLVKQVNILL